MIASIKKWFCIKFQILLIKRHDIVVAKSEKKTRDSNNNKN